MATLSSRLAPLTVSVPAMSEWVSYTPTWSSSGTQPVLGNGIISAWWRRVGDSVELRINTAFGSTTTYGTGNWKFSTPASLVIDTTKLFNATNIGSGIAYDSSALSSKALTARYDGSTDGIRLFSPEGTGGVVTATTPFTWATADEINITITLPITGWTSHTASATSANAVVVGGQSVGSALNFGATSNQGFNILANNVSVLSSTAAGAVTLGTTSANVKHILQSASTSGVAQIWGYGTGGAYLQITEDSVQDWFVGMDNGSSILKIRPTSLATASLIDVSATGVTAIKFAPTQTTSADVNTLDDYEEGTWTPVAIGTTLAGSGTYGGSQVGTYTKVGDLVYFTLFIEWSAHTGTGNLRISSLPFTAKNTSNAFHNLAGITHNNLTHPANSIVQGFVTPNTNYIELFTFVAGSSTRTLLAMDTACGFYISGTYQAAS